jgi:AcrR family transcriptional regulator
MTPPPRVGAGVGVGTGAGADASACATVAGMSRATAAAPRPRDADATRERLLCAVGEVLAREGFGAVGVNAIAKQAGVDKVLIYRYFGGLPELLQAWGRSGRFWPSVDELLRSAPPDLLQRPVAERFALFFDHFVDALRARPLTVEILAAELVQPNELTAVLEAEREAWGFEAQRVLGGPEADVPWLQDVITLLIAGVQFLLVRARHSRLWGGRDLHQDATWNHLKQSVRTLALQVMPPR